jgi:hypothetical protein
MQRPKKPALNSIKEKKFSKMIDGLRHLPHSDIISRIDSKRFSLDGNELYHYKPEVLAGEEYKRCLELFERRLPIEYSLPTSDSIIKLHKQLSMIDKSMFNKEMKHAEELKRIAVETIRSLFSIPEHVVILPEISRNLDINPEEQDDSPEQILSLEPEKHRSLMDEVRKREILNGIVNGCAMHIWKTAYYIVKEKIEELDPMLMMLYNQYTTSISWLLWQISPDEFQKAIGENAKTQGFCKLEFKQEGEADCNIHCSAINFPVLLHEVAKGAIDYLCIRGVPEGLTKEELKYYYAKADSYENEVYHYLLSPTIWIKLVESLSLDTQSLPITIARLTQLSYQELTDVLKACIDGTEVGRLKLKIKKII